MIRLDKKSSKCYVNPVNFAIFQFSQPGQPVESKNRIRDCLPDVYISENAKWTTEECTLVLGQQFNHYIGNDQINLTQTRTFEY